jgi:hypothetical protein
MLSHRSIKRLNITAFTVLLAISANLNVAQAAEILISDTFTNNPANRWYCENTGYSYCEFRTNYGIGVDGHNDYHSAWLQISGYPENPATWVGVGRHVFLEGVPRGAKISTCSVTFSLQNHTSYHYSGGNAGITGVIEIINPETWTYIHMKSFYIARLNLNWNAISTASFPFPLSNKLYVRVVIHKANGDSRELAIDNFSVRCPLG